jgi:hypothetical protein
MPRYKPLTALPSKIIDEEGKIWDFDTFPRKQEFYEKTFERIGRELSLYLNQHPERWPVWEASCKWAEEEERKRREKENEENKENPDVDPAS